MTRLTKRAVLLGIIPLISVVSARADEMENIRIPEGVLQRLNVEDYFTQKQSYTLLKPAFNSASLSQSRNNHPSKGKAVLLSLLLPGMGERYLGGSKSSVVFLSSEASLWLLIFGLDRYGDWRKEDYKVYAAAHAGVDTEGKGDQYYVDISNYADIGEYNAAKRRSRSPTLVYPETVYYSWMWDSEKSREEFEALRLKSSRAYQRITFVSGALVLNRILSAIDVVSLYNRRNKGVISLESIRLDTVDGRITLLSISSMF